MGEVEQVAVIGDVHADCRALSAVAEQIAAAGIDRVICLGDWASGGPDPARCFDWITTRCEIVLAGNHELFVLGRVWEHETAPWARAAEHAHAELGAGRVARLRDFDAYARTPYAELVHGALTNPISDLITTPTVAVHNLRLLDAPVLLYAHTHHAAHWQTPNGSDRPRRQQPRLGIPVMLDPDGQALLNPGAVTHDHRWLHPSSPTDGRPPPPGSKRPPPSPREPHRRSRSPRERSGLPRAQTNSAPDQPLPSMLLFSRPRPSDAPRRSPAVPCQGQAVAVFEKEKKWDRPVRAPTGARDSYLRLLSSSDVKNDFKGARTIAGIARQHRDHKGSPRRRMCP